MTFLNAPAEVLKQKKIKGRTFYRKKHRERAAFFRVMRQDRLKAPPDHPAGYYHCVSLVVNREFVFGNEEKGMFVKLMRRCIGLLSRASISSRRRLCIMRIIFAQRSGWRCCIGAC